MRTIALAAIACIATTSSLAAPPGESVISFPKNDCHALQRKMPQDNVPDSHASIRSQVRWDIVCIGDALRIDTPIRSNGGNVLIFANRVTFAAQVDTRPYVSPSDYPVHLPRQPVNQGNYPSQGEVPSENGVLKDLYDSYYGRAPDAVVIGDKTFLPERPSGQSGNAWTGCEAPSAYHQQRMPPATIPPASRDPIQGTKSGNITVFAASYAFDDHHLQQAGLFVGDPLVCSAQGPETMIRGKALIASGARGGRGGAGATQSEFTVVRSGSGNTSFRCVDSAFQRPGLLNARGGDGADGGDITIYVAGGAPSDAMRTQIVHRATAAGGSPGSRQKLRAPAWRGGSAPASWDACGFLKEGQWDAGATGQSGNVRVAPVSTTEAILEFARLTGMRDARTDYSYDELLRRAEIPSERVKSFTYGGFAERKFFEVLLDHQVAWLERLNVLVTQGTEPNLPTPDGIWKDIDLARLDESVFANDAAQPLRLLSDFQPRGGVSAVKSYFLNSGGLFNLRSASTLTQWASLAARTEQTLSASKLDQIKSTLTLVAENVNDIREVARSTEYRALLQDLALRLEEARKAAAAAASNHSIQNLLAGIGEAAAGVAAIVGGIESGNPAAIGSGISKLESGLEKVSIAMSAEPDYHQQIQAIRIAMQNLTYQHDRFLQYSAAQRARILLEQRQNLVDYFETNTAYGSRLQTRSALFHDLVRIVLIGYLRDPSKSRPEVRGNLSAVHTLLRSYPAREPALTLRDMKIDCDASDDAECVTIPAHEDWSTIVARASDWINDIPLYVLAPTTQKVRLRTYGATIDSRKSSASPAGVSLGYKPLAGSVPRTLLRPPSIIDISFSPR